MQYKNLTSSDLLKINTLSALKSSGYQPKSIKDELRENLIAKIKNKEKIAHYKSRLVFEQGCAEKIPFDCNNFEKIVSIVILNNYHGRLET